MLVTMILAAQLVLCTLAGYAFARFEFFGSNVAFGLVLVQLMVMPEVLIVENYRIMARLGWWTRSSASACRTWRAHSHLPAAADIQDGAARTRGGGARRRLRLPRRAMARVRALARPTYLAYGLVSVSYHWNNFLWPLVVTNSVETRPLTVGLAIFGAPESGVDWSVISAGTIMAVAPLLVAFLLFQRQFMQSFMHAGIK